jgi:hypothetical protein
MFDRLMMLARLTGRWVARRTMRSPARFAVACGAGFVLVALIGQVTNPPTVHAPTQQAVDIVRAAASIAPTTDPTAAVADTPTPAASVALTGPEQSALRFTVAWLHHNQTADTWRAGFRPYVTPELWRLFGTADPANVPADRIIDAPQPGVTVDGYTRVTVPLDALSLTVTLKRSGAGWLVSNLTAV